LGAVVIDHDLDLSDPEFDPDILSGAVDMWVDELEAMLDGHHDDFFFSSELPELGSE
jgi:hypothetical protein